MRYKLTTVHGENRTLWHIVDTMAPEGEQPDILRSFDSKVRGETYMTACCYRDRVEKMAAALRSTLVPSQESRSTLEFAERAWAGEEK